jgi:2-methylcitrate dehydratase PrpD
MTEVVENCIEANYQLLPNNVVVATKKQVLDSLAAMVGGSTCSISGEINRLVTMVKDWGGKEESSIISFGGRVPAPNAGFLNGILIVRLDFDDTQVKGPAKLHVSRAIVPTAFASAERQGGITGKELITAIALGHDLGCRLRMSVTEDVNTPFGMATNFISAAATAGKVLGLNKEQFSSALGIAFHQMSGAQTGSGTAGAGASIKGLNNGIAVKAGIMSALLSQQGFTANSDFLEPQNKKGLYELLFKGCYSPSSLTSEMGKVFAGLLTSQKEYPCCHGQHTSIEATLSLLKENNIKPDNISEVVLHLSPSDYSYLTQPLEKKQDPQNIIESQFSLCWGVASAIIYGKVNIQNFTATALQNKKIRELARKVSSQSDPHLESNDGFNSAIVDIRTRDGKLYSRRLDYPFGSPQNPMSFSDVAEKLKHCCQYSYRPIAPDIQKRVIELVNNLENVSDVSQIIRLLA